MIRVYVLVIQSLEFCSFIISASERSEGKVNAFMTEAGHRMEKGKNPGREQRDWSVRAG